MADVTTEKFLRKSQKNMQFTRLQIDMFNNLFKTYKNVFNFMTTNIFNKWYYKGFGSLRANRSCASGFCLYITYSIAVCYRVTKNTSTESFNKQILNNDGILVLLDII